MKAILPRFLCSALLAAALTACVTPEAVDPTKGWTAERLYDEAKAEQTAGNWEQSTKLFETLEARFPYGRHAPQAQLETAYNHHKAGERALAMAAIDRFIRQNPSHASMDYALYLRGLISFNDKQGFGSAIVEQDLSDRDPAAARDALNAFGQLVQRFPQSKYASDARQRMQYLLGNLAKYELHVARYYFKRGAYLAAVNRCKGLLEQYPDSVWTEQALGMMVQAYDKLGQATLRDDARRVLLASYPKSEADKEDFARDPMWWLPF